jgi:hypothetical protein
MALGMNTILMVRTSRAISEKVSDTAEGFLSGATVKCMMDSGIVVVKLAVVCGQVLKGKVT